MMVVVSITKEVRKSRLSKEIISEEFAKNIFRVAENKVEATESTKFVIKQTMAATVLMVMMMATSPAVC